MVKPFLGSIEGAPPDWYFESWRNNCSAVGNGYVEGDESYAPPASSIPAESIILPFVLYRLILNALLPLQFLSVINKFLKCTLYTFLQCS